MSKIMIYAPLSAIGGTIENVWGTEMRVKSIDSSDKDAVEQAKANGWYSTAQPVIDEIEALKMQKENTVMKAVLSDGADKDRIVELEAQLVVALEEVAALEGRLAIYETPKDKNSDGVVSYDEMTIAELSTLLTQREVEHSKRDGKDALTKLAQDSE